MAKAHPTVTKDRIMEMADRYNHSLDNPGICLACGEEAHGVEPDARKYTCDSCGEPRVYGCMELVMMIM